MKVNNKIVKDYCYVLEKAFINNRMRVVVVEINLLDDEIRYTLEVEERIKADKILSLEKEIAFCLASPSGKVKIEKPTSSTRFFNITVPYRNEELPKTFGRGGKRNFMSDTLLELSVKIYELGVKASKW